MHFYLFLHIIEKGNRKISLYFILCGWKAGAIND